MIALFKRFRENRRANAATEFAFLLPVMLSFMAGIVEFGRAFEVYTAVNRLATRYAITYSDCYDYPAGACNTELSTFTSSASIQNIAPQLTNTSTISLRMFEVVMSSTTPLTATIKYPTGSTATLSASELLQAQTIIGAGQTGVVVTASYQHTLIFAQIMSAFIGTTRTVAYTVAQRKT